MEVIKVTIVEYDYDKDRDVRRKYVSHKETKKEALEEILDKLCLLDEFTYDYDDNKIERSFEDLVKLCKDNAEAGGDVEFISITDGDGKEYLDEVEEINL